ncbi:MAG: hypothetical protein Q8936_10565 [Bacillota bacterium]|nr:hypothetical protein [Bacillota bacterium]
MKFNKKIIILIIISAALVSILVSIYAKYKPANIVKTVDNSNSKILSYNDYERLFNNMVDNFKVPGFEVKASTLGDNVTVIDKELSFDKRQYLTLDGTLNSSGTKPTDEQFTLEDKAQSKQITIGIFYTNSYIGNDLLGWPNNDGFANLNKSLSDKCSYSVLTYKNLVILIHQSSVDKADINLMNETIKSLILVLKNFK